MQLLPQYIVRISPKENQLVILRETPRFDDGAYSDDKWYEAGYRPVGIRALFWQDMFHTGAKKAPPTTEDFLSAYARQKLLLTRVVRNNVHELPDQTLQAVNAYLAEKSALLANRPPEVTTDMLAAIDERVGDVPHDPLHEALAHYAGLNCAA